MLDWYSFVYSLLSLIPVASLLRCVPILVQPSSHPYQVSPCLLLRTPCPSRPKCEPSSMKIIPQVSPPAITCCYGKIDIIFLLEREIHSAPNIMSLSVDSQCNGASKCTAYPTRKFTLVQSSPISLVHGFARLSGRPPSTIRAQSIAG